MSEDEKKGIDPIFTDKFEELTVGRKGQKWF